MLYEVITLALVRGRAYVVPDDLQDTAEAVEGFLEALAGHWGSEEYFA